MDCIKLYSHLLYRLIFTVLMITSIFEDSHVIPGLIHRAYNAVKDAKDKGIQ